ncbi:MAG: hypothetical protein AAB837_01115 [Patescibacteria group bacterium]
MNKILKSLIKFSPKERLQIQQDALLITNREFHTLNIKKLKGFGGLYRAKNGKARIVFYMNEKEVKIIKIDRRNDNTYKNL